MTNPGDGGVSNPTVKKLLIQFAHFPHQESSFPISSVIPYNFHLITQHKLHL